MLQLASHSTPAKDGLSLITTCRFSVRGLDEVNAVVVFLTPWFTHRPNAIDGIKELLHNGIEHGILGLGEHGKADLLANGTLQADVTRRLQQPENADKVVELTLTRKDNGTYIIVQDTGDGFLWKNYLNVDPTRANKPNGRGIARAATLSFDKLTYNEKGNQAVAFVSDHSEENKW